MDKLIVDNIADMLKKADSQGEWRSLWQDPKILPGLFNKAEEEMQRTLTFLSEFGQIIGPMQKLQRWMRSVKEGAAIPDLGKTVQQLAGLSHEDLLEIYSICYALFQEKKFEQAGSVAAFLGYLNPEMAPFWRMLGSCYWHQGHLELALIAFLYAAWQEPEAISHHIATLECLIKLKMTQEARHYHSVVKELLSSASLWNDVKQWDLASQSLLSSGRL